MRDLFETANQRASRRLSNAVTIRRNRRARDYADDQMAKVVIDFDEEDPRDRFADEIYYDDEFCKGDEE